jgi:phage-related protein
LKSNEVRDWKALPKAGKGTGQVKNRALKTHKGAAPGRMVLLHGFIKKTQKTPGEDLELAKRNKNKHQRGLP